MTAEDFASWLREKARAAGYDIDGPRSGGKAQLADDAGVSRGQVGRALAGEVIPDIKSQRGLARALRVPLREMLVRSGTIDPSDIPTEGEAPVLSTREELAEAGRRMGITEDKLHLFIASAEAVAAALANPAS